MSPTDKILSAREEPKLLPISKASPPRLNMFNPLLFRSLYPDTESVSVGKEKNRLDRKTPQTRVPQGFAPRPASRNAPRRPSATTLTFRSAPCQSGRVRTPSPAIVRAGVRGSNPKAYKTKAKSRARRFVSFSVWSRPYRGGCIRPPALTRSPLIRKGSASPPLLP